MLNEKAHAQYYGAKKKKSEGPYISTLREIFKSASI